MVSFCVVPLRDHGDGRRVLDHSRVSGSGGVSRSVPPLLGRVHSKVTLEGFPSQKTFFHVPILFSCLTGLLVSRDVTVVVTWTD